MADSINESNALHGSTYSIQIHDVRQVSENVMPHATLLQQFICPPLTTERPQKYELFQPDGSLRTVHLPDKLRHLPTEILYDGYGLQLFDDITFLEEEYYLTSCERKILQTNMASIAAHIPNNASVIELGCGNMRKTAIILHQLQAAKKQGIKFFAVDIEEQSLRSSLASLVNDEESQKVSEEYRISYAGILGTYQQALAFFAQMTCSARVFLWLGSSIGNYCREDAAAMLTSFAQNAMGPADCFFIGMDKRNDAPAVAQAYNDSQGVTAKFAMNGLYHINELFNTEVFKKENFEYFAGYNQTLGRHESAYYRSKLKQMVPIPQNGQSEDGSISCIALDEGELIRFEMSYKYSWEEVERLAEQCSMHVKDHWADPSDRYFFCLFSKGVDCTSKVSPPALVTQLLGKSLMPTMQDWYDVWCNWDAVTSPDVISDYSQQPIHLRHPIIFYIGHIPTFCDLILSRCLGQPQLEPQYFQTIFERGIDPVVEDPSQCHAHSEVPSTWPPLADILDHKQRVRQKLTQLYDNFEGALRATTLCRLGRVLHMALEHEIIHTETLLYMLVQSDTIKPRPLPPHLTSKGKVASLCAPQWLTVKGGTVSIGLDDDEAADLTQADLPEGFGWDNESPMREVLVKNFQIHHRPVSNGEYQRFLHSFEELPPELVPASFITDDEGRMAVRTMHGPIPLDLALNWPVSLTYHQASAYLEHLQHATNDHSLRIPTEAELWQYYRQYGRNPSTCNIGLQQWCPLSLSDHEPHVYGSVWEWTSTVFDASPGFKASLIYPGYSTDFFDGLHQVVLGGSWATHPRLVGRYRNFYQRSYPFAFIGIRFCRDVKDDKTV